MDNILHRHKRSAVECKWKEEAEEAAAAEVAQWASQLWSELVPVAGAAVVEGE
jgi:hypothetical protein